jgi:hypothetical protein
MGAKLNEAGARATSGANVPNAPPGGFFGTIVDAFKEEYRLVGELYTPNPVDAHSLEAPGLVHQPLSL